MSKDVSFLLLSGGVGARSGHHEPKQFRRINSLEMMAYSLQVADAHPRVGEIIVNAPSGFHDMTLGLCARHVTQVPFHVLPCGTTRQESVGILAQAASRPVILLHEAARPMLDAQMIDRLLACENGNAGLFAAIPFSMCEVDPEQGIVLRNVPRARVFNIQLPQKFVKSDLKEAHGLARAQGLEFTEDAVMIQQLLRKPVAALQGAEKNIKVTTPDDFDIVGHLLYKESLQ